jgi:hypothetical protein
LDKKRWGVVSYQEPGMLDLARQASPAALVKELLLDFLNYHFTNLSQESNYVVPVSQLFRALSCHSPDIMRKISPDAFGRHMDSMDKQVPSIVSTGPSNTKIWTFNRCDFVSPETDKKLIKEMGTGGFNAPTHDSL